MRSCRLNRDRLRKMRPTLEAETSGMIAIWLGLAIAVANANRAHTIARADVGTIVVHHGAACFSVQNARLLPAAMLVVVSPQTSRPVGHATIVGPRAARAEQFDRGATGYAVHVVGMANGTIAIGLTTRAANLGDARATACTSSEGVHLNIWAGRPKASTRLWHAYTYLGYDVEPTCAQSEMGEFEGT